MALDTITLKCFLSVVETGNITKTAHLIGRTQSAVSQQLARLEALLGKNLFNRENGFKLNHDGEIFYLYAKKIYQLQLESINRLNNTDSEGEIKIGLPEDFASKRKESVVPLILSPKESIYRDLVLKTLDSANIKWRVVFNSRSYANKTLAAIAGLGVTVVQKSLIPTDNNLVTIPNLPALGMINLCILQNKNSAAIKYLVKLLVKIITGTN
jgi:DNA-binding transcriptional LysR family regulator